MVGPVSNTALTANDRPISKAINGISQINDGRQRPLFFSGSGKICCVSSTA